MTILEFHNVYRNYGSTEALRGVNLTIDAPGVYALIGRNGAGKSTLLRMIPCLLHPDRGSVRVFGVDPWLHQEEVKGRMGYLSENDAYPSHLKVRDLLDVNAECRPTWDGAMARTLLARFEIDTGRRLSALSKGQLRLVGLLCAVCHRPELLVMDEPASGLDAVVHREFLQVVIELLASAGGTVLLSTHFFADVERLAEHVIILHKGQVLARDSVENFKAHTSRIACRAEGAEAVAATCNALAALPECVRAAHADGGVTATLRLAPEEARERTRQLGLAVEQAVPVTLEDLFVEWTGGTL